MTVTSDGGGAERAMKCGVRTAAMRVLATAVQYGGAPMQWGPRPGRLVCYFG